MSKPQPIPAHIINPSKRKSAYPTPFAEMMDGRTKRKLGNHFSLSNFGVNLTELVPGAISALKHAHTTQDEFIYILSGTATLLYGEEQYVMQAGDCMGFKANEQIAHQLKNSSDKLLQYLEIGDRSAGDQVNYPDNDLIAKSDMKGNWQFLHKNGEPY